MIDVTIHQLTTECICKTRYDHYFRNNTEYHDLKFLCRVLKMCRRPAISPATSGWAPSTNLSKIKIEVGKTEMLSRYLLFSRSLL